MRYVILTLLAFNAAANAQWQDLRNLGPPVNTMYSEEEPAVAQIGPIGALMVLSSNRPGGYGGRDLWSAQTYNISRTWDPPINLGNKINTAGWEGTPFFTDLDRKVYFASDGIAGGYGGRDIWWCRYGYGYPLPDEAYNVGPPLNTLANETHPVISQQEDVIFFASDRPGGYGGYDIWMSTKSGGMWQSPVNIGPPINTAGDDFPEWTPGRGPWYLLAFSTGRAGGYGKFDLWYSYGYPGNWLGPFNFKPPINSEKDDAGCCFYLHHNSISGIMFFGTFDRTSGYGDFDIWTVTSYTSLKPASLGMIKASWR